MTLYSTNNTDVLILRTLVERLPVLVDGSVPTSLENELNINSSNLISNFIASRADTTISLVSILASNSNRYKILICNPIDANTNINFVFANESDSPILEQCLCLKPGSAWIEEGQYTAASKAVYAQSEEDSSVVIWQWIK